MARGIKTGGRRAGTPNKTTAINKQVISELIANYNGSGLLLEDFMALEPRDRLMVFEKMLQYIMPKMQATAIQVGASTGEGLEEKLKKLSLEND